MVLYYYFSLFTLTHELNIRRTLAEENIILNTDYLIQKKYQDYILGPGDIINISLSKYLPELDKQAIIEASGQINLPQK